MAFASVEPFENATIEAFYQYEWEPLEAPAPGSYFSFLDVGSRNAVDHASVSFGGAAEDPRSEEHTSELQSLMRISYAVFCWKKKKKQILRRNNNINKTIVTLHII